MHGHSLNISAPLSAAIPTKIYCVEDDEGDLIVGN